VSCAKTAQQIDFPDSRLGSAGLQWAQGSASSIVFATWRIRLNRPSATAMWHYV